MTHARQSERGLHASGRLRNVAAAVLAGGESRRMGRDKAGARLEGQSLGRRVVDVLDGIFEDVLWVGGEPPGDVAPRCVPDTDGPRSSLRGLVTALEAASAPRLLVVATDLPLVSPALLLALLAAPEADVVAPVTSDGPQPLCAVYRVGSVLDLARSRLASDRLALRGLLAELETEWLEGADLAAVDPDGHALANVNTPEDLEAAGRWLAARD